MPIDILMPALSPTMEKGNLAKWLKKEGDSIKAGDVIAEIETDKATMEVEAVDEGTLAKIVVPEGSADVPVNQVIGIIAGEGEDASAAKAGAASAPAPAAPKAESMTLREERPGATAGAPDTRADKPKPAPKPASAQANGAGAGDRVFASPLARRLARQAGIDLSGVKGTGPHGRIIERDIREAEKRGPAPAAAEKPVPTAAPSAAPSGFSLSGSMSDETIKKFFEPGSYQEIPHDSMRKTIARRLSEADAIIPQYYLTLDCEIDALLALREQINKAAPLSKEGKAAYKVSVNDFIIKALAMALQRVPDLNATWTENAMLRHKHVDIGVAVSIPSGLITPVVRKAELKTISAISNEMRDFAARAKERKLKPDEYQGGTTAVSNLGMYGIKQFTAVINPPQASILAVGEAQQRVIVRNGAPAVANLMTVTLTVDHRVADGATGAQLISAFKTIIEAPMSMLV